MSGCLQEIYLFIWKQEVYRLFLPRPFSRVFLRLAVAASLLAWSAVGSLDVAALAARSLSFLLTLAARTFFSFFFSIKGVAAAGPGAGICAGKHQVGMKVPGAGQAAVDWLVV